MTYPDICSLTCAPPDALLLKLPLFGDGFFSAGGDVSSFGGTNLSPALGLSPRFLPKLPLLKLPPFLFLKLPEPVIVWSHRGYDARGRHSVCAERPASFLKLSYTTFNKRSRPRCCTNLLRPARQALHRSQRAGATFGLVAHFIFGLR